MSSVVMCNKWMALKIFEFVLSVSCVVAKRVTDDETSRLHLLLQRRSREWPLLTRVAWGRVGDAFGDAVYGGYVIITAGLLLARIVGEMPHGKRITEYFFLGIGAVLFVIIGSLEFAAIDDLPPKLMDNAAILGSLSIILALMFIIDLAGPKHNKYRSKAQDVPTKNVNGTKSDLKKSKDIKKTKEKKSVKTISQPNSETINIEKEATADPDWEPYKKPSPKPGRFPVTEEDEAYYTYSNRARSPIHWELYEPRDRNQQQNKSQGRYIPPNAFSYEPRSNGSVPKPSENGDIHGPVWSRTRAPRGQYDNVGPLVPIKQNQQISYLLPMPPLAEAPEPHNGNMSPSSPTDPGYVQYTAGKWGQEEKTKTPKHSPTEV